MSIVMMEGWDQLDLGMTDAQIRSYMAASGWYDPGGAGGASYQLLPGPFGYGKSLRLNVSYGPFGWQSLRALPRRYTEDCALGIRLSITAGSQLTKIGLYDSSSNSFTMSVSFDTTLGVIRVRNSADTVIGSSRIGSFLIGAYLYLTVRWRDDPGGKRVMVDVNGENYIDLVRSTGLGTGFDAIALGKLSGNTGIYITDDIYLVVDDGIGHTDALGNIIVGALRPRANGSEIDWTPVGATTNWEASRSYSGVLSLSNNVYNETGTVGAEDLYLMDPAMDAIAIYGIQLTNFFRQTDGLQRFGQNSYKVGGTIYRSLRRGMNSSFGALHSIVEDNPDTGSPWTTPSLTSIEMGGRFEGTE